MFKKIINTLSQPKHTEPTACSVCQYVYTDNKETYVQRQCLSTILAHGGIDDMTQGHICIPCAIEKANDIINKQVDTVKVHTTRPSFAKKYEDLHHNKFLIEGIDYQTDARGRWVLSRWHLLKREKCCGSGCRNCPYGHANVKNKNR